MKLLLQKKRKQGRPCSNGITIMKSGFAIKGNAYERLIEGKDIKEIYGSLGINNEGNICLYLSYKHNDQFYKMHKAIKENVNAMRVSLSTKYSEVLNPYLGVYEIKYVSLNDNKITEVILKKI